MAARLVRVALLIGYLVGCLVFGRSPINLWGAVIVVVIAASFLLDLSLYFQTRQWSSRQ